MTGEAFLNFLVGTSTQTGLLDKNPDDAEYRAFMLACLNLVLKDISNRQQTWHWRWLEKTATAPTVSGQMDYDMPTDIDTNKIFSVFDRTQNRTYTFKPHDLFLRLVPNPSIRSGEPGWYTIWGDALKLYPVPSSVFTVYMKYVKTITALADDSNSSDIPTKYDEIVIDGALKYAYKFDPELGELATQVALYENGITLMKKDNNMNINELTQTESHRNHRHGGRNNLRPFPVNQ